MARPYRSPDPGLLTVAAVLDALASFRASRAVWWTHYDEARQLATVGELRQKLGTRNPAEVFTVLRPVGRLQWKRFAAYQCGLDSRGRLVLAVMER